MDLQEFFRQRCSEMLVLEREFWLLNNLMAQEIAHADTKNVLRQRGELMRRQISNLEQVVDRLGGITGPEEHPVAQALLRVHRQFMEQHPPQALVDMFNGLEAEKMEQFTVAAYDGLVTLARQLGQHDIIHLLEQNRLSEEQMRNRAEHDLPTLVSALSAQLRRAA